jgi:tricorn protease
MGDRLSRSSIIAGARLAQFHVHGVRIMRNRCLVSSAIMLAGVAASMAVADPIKFARFPHIANDGRLAFAYHGDIWVADADGSNARRLTAHIASDSSPRFSPDGTMIAFTSARMGNDEVWEMSSAGGEPQQHTFASTGDNDEYWMHDGTSVLFATSSGAG